MILFSLNSSTRLLSGKQSMSIMSKIKLAKKNFCELYHFTTSETSCYADFIIAFYRKYFTLLLLNRSKSAKDLFFHFFAHLNSDHPQFLLSGVYAIFFPIFSSILTALVYLEQNISAFFIFEVLILASLTTPFLLLGRGSEKVCLVSWLKSFEFTKAELHLSNKLLYFLTRLRWAVSLKI